MTARAVATGHPEFICEELTPAPGTGDAAMAARGEPGLPQRFAWRGEEYHVVGVIEMWKTNGPCRHGSGEMYLRRHWYKIQVARGLISERVCEVPVPDLPTLMTVYCDRQAKNRRKPKSRWFVYTVEDR